MAEIVVLGAGVVGLGTAMLLAKDGHRVTVLERDPSAPASSPDEAWESWERRGVNQFRLPHFFLARYRSVIDAELPEIAQSIEQIGGLRFNPLLDAPESFRGPERPEDAESEVLTGRRPVVELAVAAAAAATPGLTVRRGVTVSCLLSGTTSRDGVPHVVGVRTESGDEVRADLVVDLTGRRSPMPRWLDDLGAKPLLEEFDDSGFMYFGRHYRSPDGSLPFAFGGGIQHYGTISALTLPADNGTWGVVIVTSAKDKAMLGLRDLTRWESVVRSLPLIAHWLEGAPIDDKVMTISKIEDRLRTYDAGGSPVVTGVVAVGDSWACSNPSLGRGASFGMLQAVMLRDLLRSFGPDSPAEFAETFWRSTSEHVLPWFSWTRATDRHRLAQVEAGIAGTSYEPDDPDFEFEQSLTSAASKDPDLLRISVRGALVLERPDEAVERLDLVERMSKLGSGWRDEPVAAPDRDELVRLASG